jgi:hypothetical protein
MYNIVKFINEMITIKFVNDIKLVIIYFLICLDINDHQMNFYNIIYLIIKD